MNSDLLFFRLGALKNLVDATASRWLKAAMRDWKHFMARKYWIIRKIRVAAAEPREGVQRYA